MSVLALASYLVDALQFIPQMPQFSVDCDGKERGNYFGLKSKLTLHIELLSIRRLLTVVKILQTV